MKNKITRLLGIGLTIAVLTSLLVAPFPASAGTHAWGAETNALPVPKTEDYILATAGGNIADMAVNGDTMYIAVNGTTSANYTLKSTDGGATWSSLHRTTSYPSQQTNPQDAHPQKGFPKLVAVAPDNPDVVCIVSVNNTVYYSSNGGNKWSNMGIPTSASAVADIDISAESGGAYYLAAGGNTTAGVAALWILKLDIAQSWANRWSATDTPASQTVMPAVKFSPNFSVDKIVMCVTGSTTTAPYGNTDAYFNVYRDGGTGYRQWNGGIDYYEAADWGSGIQLDTGTGSQDLVGQVERAEISTPTTYLGTEAGERIAFVALAGESTGGGGGVVRLVDAYAKHFQTWAAGTEGPCSSIAYHDDGKLLAGDMDSNQVYVCLSPMATSPKFERLNTYKGPGGVNMTQVAWSGDTAVATADGDESAFAISTDDGYSFNDISMIDTELDVYTDVAVNADGTKVYLATAETSADDIGGTADVSVWCKASTWKRVLLSRNVQTANMMFLLRVAPEDDSAIYVAYGASQNMCISKNSGMETWKNLPCRKVTTIQDLAVESADKAFAIDTAGASKTTNAGASWGAKKSWATGTGHNVQVASNGDILVGCSDGYVTFSKDDGSTFDTTSRVASSGNTTVHLVPAGDYADSNMLFVAADNDIYRGKAQKETQTWADRGDLDGNEYPVGMAEYEGIAYVCSNATLYRAMNLATAPNAALAEWSSKSASTSTANRAFKGTPQGLRISPDVSAKAPKLWALVDSQTAPIAPDVNPGRFLYSFNDPIATASPPLMSPAEGFVVTVNKQTGRAHNVTFTWERAYTDKSVTGMQVQIATNTNFDDAIYDQTFTGIDSDTITRVIGPYGDTTAPTKQAEFNSGETYYWRVRVSQTGPMYSQWSEVRSFTVESVEAPFAIASPIAGATGVDLMPTFTWNQFEGAIGYEIMVAEDPTFAIIDWSRSVSGGDLTFYRAEEALAYNTTYYWRVRGVTGPAAPKQAAPGGPWVVGMFTTMEKSVPPEPTVIVQKEPAPPAPPPTVIEVPQPAPPAPVDSTLLYVIIAIGGVLVIALIVLIIRTRRVV
jgi:hypothetical protein